MELSKRYDYGFEDFELEIEPDFNEDASGIGGDGIAYLGLDNDKTALMLLKHEYVSPNSAEQDNGSLDITLSLTNLVRNILSLLHRKRKGRGAIIRARVWEWQSSSR